MPTTYAKVSISDSTNYCTEKPCQLYLADYKATSSNESISLMLKTQKLTVVDTVLEEI